MNEFFIGFFYPVKSLSYFFRHPKIVLYSIVPMIINAIIYGTIFFFSYKWILNRTAQISGADDANAELIQEILNIFLIAASFIILLVICYLLFVTIGGLVTAPFNERISRLVEENLTRIKIVDNITFWQDAWLSIKAETLKLLFYFAIVIPLFLINFIPVIGSVISTAAGLLFSFFYNALDFIDYPLTRRFFKLKQKIKIVHKAGLLSYGFGCMAFLMMFFPIINVFFKPVLVVSGTSLFFEKNYLKYQ